MTEVNNVENYLRTKFFRALISIRKQDQGASKAVYHFVPLQNFSKPWTDEELYAKYGLTEEEIAFIESMIRPME
jgi:site-specific DNA-methyltransferase (adenine-specific)